MTSKLITGAGASAASAKGQSTENMMIAARIRVNVVSVQYISPGPAIIRTAPRSFVDRAMISPVWNRP